MKKRFNTTGVCVPTKHYMVDISNKVDKIKDMIRNDEYFIINRPRQYGKTTIIYALERELQHEFFANRDRINAKEFLQRYS